jgi:hypothetical protein
MALSPDFTVSQSAITPASVTVTDTSTGSDVTITQRRIYVQTGDVTYLTGDGTVNYTAWPLVDGSITLDILTQDTAANIRVDWLNVSDVIVETLNNNYPLCEFGKQFFYYLIQLQGLTPNMYQDLTYSGNLATFWATLNGGINAVEDGNDIAAGQNCFNIETNMQQNQSYFF